jgi:hypothetical protein
VPACSTGTTTGLRPALQRQTRSTIAACFKNPASRPSLNDKTFLDNYRTPHTDKLHVTERWRLIENGAKLEILMTIDDPGTFNEPWQALRQYDRKSRTFAENICSENNANLFDYGTPTAERPDF